MATQIKWYLIQFSKHSPNGASPPQDYYRACKGVEFIDNKHTVMRIYALPHRADFVFRMRIAFGGRS